MVKGNEGPSTVQSCILEPKFECGFFSSFFLAPLPIRNPCRYASVEVITAL